MSDTPRGPDWWQASDGRWYPPAGSGGPGDQATRPAGPPTSYQDGPPTAVQGPSYDTMPAQAPGSSLGSSRPLLYGVTAVVVVLAVAIVFLLVTDDGDGNGGTSAEGSNGAGESTGQQARGGPCPREEVGDDLVLLECGFSAATDRNTLLPSFGFVVENTSNEDRQHAQFSVTLYDEDDGVIDTYDATFRLIPAGATMGFGDTATTYGDITGSVSDIEVSYGGLGRALTHDGPGAGSFEVSNVQTSQSDSSLVTTFNVSSTYPERVNSPRSYVIYRNADGEIIGGSYTYAPSFVSPDSRAGARVTTFGILEDLDPDKTDVYVDLPG